MAAGDTQITIAGNLVDDPELRFTPSGQPVAKFRVASTPRFKDNQTGEWKDGDSLFLTCNVWRQAAENVAESLTRGMRVIVSGRLRQRSYETKEGEKRTVYEVEVDDVGPSLRNASAKVNRASRNGAGGGQRDQGGGPGGRSSGGGQGGGDADPWASDSGGGGFTDEPPFWAWPHLDHEGRPGSSQVGLALAGERRASGVRRAAAALLDPGRDGVGVGSGQAAQPGGRPGQRLVRLALRCPLEDPGHLGQQIGPAVGQRAEFGQRGRFLLLGERAPPGAMPRLAGQLSHQDPVGLRPRSLIPHSYSLADLRRYRQRYRCGE